MAQVDLKTENLVKLGILKQIDVTEWGTPIVAIPKSDSSIRVCSFSVSFNRNVKTLSFNKNRKSSS